MLAQGKSGKKAKLLRKKNNLENIFKKVATTVTNGDISIIGIEASEFNHIFSELCVSGNGLVLNREWMVLPETLHKKSIELAHRDAHLDQSGLTRRLKNNLFFHNMDKKVKTFVEKCKACNEFTDKKTKEILTPVKKLPEKCLRNAGRKRLLISLGQCHHPNILLLYKT